MDDGGAMWFAQVGARYQQQKRDGMEQSKDVYKKIAAVSARIAQDGISKSRSNAQQGYKFRGIDDVYNALSPILSQHDLVMLPRVLSRQVTERTTSKGGALFYVVVEAEFDIVAASDGSRHTIKTYGEAMDSADKATNKAMSAAYKYAAMQAFCIPTEGDNDADAHTHEVAPRAVATPAAKAPLAIDENELDACCIAMQDCNSVEALKSIFGAAYKRANKEQQSVLKAAYDKQKLYLELPEQA